MVRLDTVESLILSPFCLIIITTVVNHRFAFLLALMVAKGTANTLDITLEILKFGLIIQETRVAEDLKFACTTIIISFVPPTQQELGTTFPLTRLVMNFSLDLLLQPVAKANMLFSNLGIFLPLIHLTESIQRNRQTLSLTTSLQRILKLNLT